MREVVIPYAPRAHQWEIHNNDARFKVLVCHRRFGKTVCAINELLRKALLCEKKNPRFAYIAPTYTQAKRIAWDYVQEFSRCVPSASYNQQELRCDLPNSARLTLYGADNPDSLRGIYLDGVVLDEVAQMPRKIWGEIIRPALSDREGWAWFIGTPQGHNLFYELYTGAKNMEGWHAALYPVSQTGVVNESELKQARSAMSEEEYEQEFECSFTAAIVGAYYGKLLAQAEREGRICNVPHDPNYLVSTWWDLGITDSTAIWFTQAIGREIRVIDFYESNGKAFPEYVKLIKERPYNYDRHMLPHDGAAAQLSTGKSIQEQGYDLGIKFDICPKLPVQNGINAARSIIPKCVWDARKCHDGLEALKQYRRDWDERKGCFRDKPLHDWTSHAADAFRYFAVGYYERPSPTDDIRLLPVFAGQQVKSRYVESNQQFWG